MTRLCALCALCALASGCAGGLRFGQPALSYQGRVLLLDAEEELLTARAQVLEAQREEERARTAWAQARARVDFFERGADGEGGRRFGLEEARSQGEAAKAALAAAKKRVLLAEAEGECAALRYEAEGARIARVTKAEGHDALAPERLAQRAGVCADALEAPRDALRVLEEESARARVAWEKRRAQLAKLSPLVQVQPYLDD